MESVDQTLATGILDQLSLGDAGSMSAADSAKVLQMIDQIGTKLDLDSIKDGKFVFANNDLAMNVEKLSLEIRPNNVRRITSNKRECSGIDGTKTRMEVDLDTVADGLDKDDRNRIDRTICVAYAKGSHS